MTLSQLKADQKTELTKAKVELESAKKSLAEKQAYLEKLQNASQAF